MARIATFVCAAVLAVGLSGCTKEYCESVAPNPLSALVQAMLCWSSSFPDSNLPTASFTIDKEIVDSGDTVRLDASASRDEEGPIDRYQWDLDGEPGYETDAGGEPVIERRMTYRGGGLDPETRFIELRITDDEGKIGIGIGTIRIKRPPDGARPVAAFTATPNPVSVLETVTFDASGSTGAATYEWDTDGNGTFEVTPSTSPTFARRYDGPGLVKVKVRVSDDVGRTDTAEVELRVVDVRAAATAAARRRPLAVRLTRVRFPDDLGMPRQRGSVSTFPAVRVRGRLSASGRGALRRFRRAAWTARLSFSADPAAGVARVRGHALARFRGAGRACLRISATRRRGAPTGRVVLLGGTGDAGRLRGAGTFRFGFRGATPRPTGRLSASLGRPRPLPRACAGL